jgi:hypothetical protein
MRVEKNKDIRNDKKYIVALLSRGCDI